jgi:ATP-dependent protease Clp ATPase subunit
MSPGEPPVLDQPRGGTGDRPEFVADVVQPVDVRDQVDVRIQKSNVLPIGPSGSGTTQLFGLLASDLDIPLVIGDATSLTEIGYVGDDHLWRRLRVRNPS